MEPVTLPSAELLALAGMGFVALFALWEMQLAPRLRAFRTRSVTLG